MGGLPDDVWVWTTNNGILKKVLKSRFRALRSGSPVKTSLKSRDTTMGSPGFTFAFRYSTTVASGLEAGLCVAGAA